MYNCIKYDRKFVGYYVRSPAYSLVMKLKLTVDLTISAAVDIYILVVVVLSYTFMCSSSLITGKSAGPAVYKPMC